MRNSIFLPSSMAALPIAWLAIGLIDHEASPAVRAAQAAPAQARSMPPVEPTAYYDDLPVETADDEPAPAPAIGYDWQSGQPGQPSRLFTPTDWRDAVSVGEPPVAPGRPPTPHQRKKPRVIRMKVTAFCPCRVCCGSSADGVTASGRPVSADGGRFVAADKRLLPFNTRLSVPGYAGGKPVRVLDAGSAIRGSRLDVFFPDHASARKWGVRRLDVNILD